jgi:tetratricopeptide (TPR) repeat protein
MGLLNRIFRTGTSRGGNATSARAVRADRATDHPAGDDVGQHTDHSAEGDRLLASGSPQQALDVYQKAIDAEDDCTAGHLGQARAYVALNRIEDACDSLEIALAIDPDCVAALQLLGGLRRDGDRAAEAIDLLKRAVAIAPERADLHFDLARALNRAGRIDAAMQAYRHAIERDPSDPAAPNNLGLIHLHDLGEPQLAEGYFRRVLEVAPTHDAGMLNLALALQYQGRYDESLALYEEGMRRYPGHVELRWNEALALLSLGEYRRGWPGYQCRFGRSISRKLDHYPFPDWDGSVLEDGGLLVLAEQGLGDEIMFGSCVPDLQPLVRNVVLECSPRLATLFARSFPQVAVHGVARNASLDWLHNCPGLVAKVPIGSLPLFLRNAREDFPCRKGYLVPDAPRVHAYRDRLHALGGKLRVGISWRGGARTTHGAVRSIELSRLSALFAVPGVRFVSVQHGLTESERENTRAAGFTLFEDAMSNLDEAAALFAALDLVISVTNTNAHLAGALGIPAWVLLNESPDWRWLRAGDRSPWYPSMSLLRSKGEPRWANLVPELARRLAAAVADPSSIRSGPASGGAL